jgi:hypothetical protein
MKWNPAQQHLMYGHIAEGVREIGILWLVFSMLDRILANRLTLQWSIANVAGSVAIWLLGLYIDIARHR